jgi:hypothetical protein
MEEGGWITVDELREVPISLQTTKYLVEPGLPLERVKHKD